MSISIFKKFIPLGLVLFFLIIVPNKVLAYCTTLYPTSLSIGYGRSFTTRSRSYTEGYNNMHMISAWNYSSNGSKTSNSSKLSTEYIDDASSYCMTIGESVDDIESMATILNKSWGYHAAGNRYYYFTTKINNQNYNGISSNSLRLNSSSNEYEVC